MTEQSQSLTVIERAQVALQPAANDKQLAELAVQSKSITTITNAAGYQQCHSARMALKNQRVAIEKIAKSAREDATAFSKAVIAEEKRLIGIIEPEEKRLETLQSEWDAARAAEKAAREEAERARVAEIQRRLVKLESLGSGEIYTSEMAPDRLQGVLQQLEEPSAYDYAEFSEQATTLRQRAIVAIRQAHVEALERVERETAERAAREAEERRLAAEREAEESRKAAERQAEEERLAEVRRRLDAEQAEQRRVSAIQERIKALRGPQHLTATDSPMLIETAIKTLEGAPIDETYEEFTGAAARTKEEGIGRLSALLEAARAHRAEQERIATEREALERQQREQAERQAEIERREREQREAAERQRREAAEAEERRQAEERAERERQEADAARQRIAEQHREEQRQRISALSAVEIVEIVADVISDDEVCAWLATKSRVAARIAEIPHEEWVAIAVSGDEKQERAA